MIGYSNLLPWHTFIYIIFLQRRMTALQRVCLGNRPTIWTTLRGRARDHDEPPERRDSVVKQLLDNGADITLKDSVSFTHFARTTSEIADLIKFY